MLRAMLRDLRAHRGRIAMTLVAIVLGVAFVVATWVVSDSTAASVSGAGTRNNVTVAVRGPEHGPVLTEADRTRLAGLSDVDRATGVLAGRAALVGSDGKVIPGRHADAGTGWDDTGRFELLDGRAPAPGEVVLAESSANRAGLRIGDAARILLDDGGDVRLRVVGIYDYRTLGVETAPAVAFDPTTTLLGDKFDRIEVVGGDPAAVAAAFPDLRVDTGAALVAEARDELVDSAQSTRESLLAFAAVALLVGMFVIANTFTMLVTQRVRQFALLRAVGAGRRQVRRAVLLEATVLGLLGATIGAALGVGLGLLAMWAFAPAGETVSYAVTPLAIGIGYLVGVGVTVVAAYGSARRAAAVAPVAALRTDATPPKRNTVVRTVAGAVVLAAGVVMVIATAGADLSTGERVLGMAGGVVGWLGVLLLAPVLAGMFLGPVARLVGRRGGPAARLATRNAVRDPRRTAATSSALLVGLALVCAFATLGQTMVSLFGDAVRGRVPAEVTVVRSAAGDEPLGTDVLDRVAAAPGVDAVAADRYGRIGVRHAGGSGTSTVSAIEPDGFTEVLTPALVEGSADLRQGVVVGSNEAAMQGVGLGDEVSLEFEGAEPVRQRIVGLYETVEGQPLFYLDVAKAPAWFQDQVTTVYARGEDPAAVRAGLDTAFRDRPDVAVTDREGVIEAEMGEFQLILSVMYAMFGAAVVIAIFGVVNTLALSVMERTREIGVLRAIGASRRLVRRAVRWESVVICGYGGVLGIVVGLLFGAVMQHVMLGQPLLAITVPYLEIGIALAGMVLVGVLAAVWPARRASRTDVLNAIATE
jgi:putative ABC transport system permease protein